MKKIRIFFAGIKESFKSVFRNFSLSVASISCITITLIFVGISIILSENVNKFTSDIEKDVTIVVYLNKELTEEDKEAILVKIDTLSNIDSVTFLSNEDIRKEMSLES